MDKLDMILKEIQSLRFEMKEQFNEIKREIKEHHIENVKADEIIMRDLMEMKSSLSDELVTHEHQFNVISNKMLRLEADIDRIKQKL